MNNYGHPRTTWLIRISIVAALAMLVAGVALISGYLGSPNSTSTPTALNARTSTPVARSTEQAVVATIMATSVSGGGPSVTPDAEATSRAFAQVRATVTVAAHEAIIRSTVTAQAASVATSTVAAQAASGATSTSQWIAQATNTAQSIEQANGIATGVSQALASMTATMQISGAIAQPQASIARPTFAAVFETNFYHEIDFARAAREQGGANVTLYSQCEHIYCWYMKTASGKKPMDIKGAVAAQFGPGWTAIAIGIGKNDWRAVKFSDLGYVVLPVMMIASDRLNDVAGVNAGLGRLKSMLANSQTWYYEHVGRTFRLMQPLVITSSRTAAQWNSITGMYADKDTLAQTARSQYANQLPAPGENLRIVIAPYTGGSYAIEQSALSMPNFAVVPPLTTSLTCPQSGPLDKSCQSAAYLVDQALGLSFGLTYSCSTYPADPLCHISIMQNGKPPGAVLLQPEIDKLARSPFFSRY